jgi:CTP synthase
MPRAGVETRDENSDLGGTMRLGGQLCRLGEGTMARAIYGTGGDRRTASPPLRGQQHAARRTRENGLVVSGRAPVTELCEIVELPTDGADAHPWFLGCQFHPEFTSSPRKGTPCSLPLCRRRGLPGRHEALRL